MNHYYDETVKKPLSGMAQAWKARLLGHTVRVDTVSAWEIATHYVSGPSPVDRDAEDYRPVSAENMDTAPGVYYETEDGTALGPHCNRARKWKREHPSIRVFAYRCGNWTAGGERIPLREI